MPADDLVATFLTAQAFGAGADAPVIDRLVALTGRRPA